MTNEREMRKQLIRNSIASRLRDEPRRKLKLLTIVALSAGLSMLAAALADAPETLTERIVLAAGVAVVALAVSLRNEFRKDR